MIHGKSKHPKKFWNSTCIKVDEMLAGREHSFGLLTSTVLRGIFDTAPHVYPFDMMCV